MEPHEELKLESNIKASQEPKKLLFLINPHAGKGEIRTHALELIDCFIAQGWEVTVHTTRRAGEIPLLLLQRAGHFDRVVCCGGDGTLNETVSGLMSVEHPPQLGYIPAGTVNDFASSLGLSRELLRAAQVAGAGKPFAFDVGRFNARTFTYIAAFGMFTDVAYETPQQSKNLLGRSAYILEGLRRLPQIKSFRMELTAKDRFLAGDFLFGMVSNAKSVGGMALAADNRIAMDDGLMECVLVRQPQSMQETQKAVNAVLARDYQSDSIVAFRTSGLTIRSPDLAPWTLDGEYGGSPGEIEIENLHGALTIAVGTPDSPGENHAD